MSQKISPDYREILQAAKEESGQIVQDRRTLHKNPEVGMNLPHTKEYVKARLESMGYKVSEPCENGLCTTICGPGYNEKDENLPCILLRADMDALKITEKTELEFKSENGAMHACGHDMHSSMLLGAARLLKDFQSEIKGCAKLVFQPDEEGFTGAKKMLASGVLENPKPSCGVALHVHSGTPSGLFICNKGTAMAGCTLFRIRVKGTGCHGAMPETGVDPIYAATQIYSAVSEIGTREIAAQQLAVITIGKFRAGDAPNIIPGEALMEGTIRTFDKELSEKILARIGEIAQNIAKGLRAEAETEEISSAPPLINNPELVDQMAGYISKMLGPNSTFTMQQGGMGSEDFSSYTYEIPCAYLLLGAGAKSEDPRYGEPMHNEKVVFNEAVLPIGAAALAACAIGYLQSI